MPDFGAKEGKNESCEAIGADNLGAFMGNEEMKVNCSESQLYFHSNKQCEVDLVSSKRSTMLACNGLKVKLSHGLMDIRDCVDSDVQGENTIVVMEGSSNTTLADGYYTYLSAEACKHLTVNAEDSRVMARRSTKVTAEGSGMICALLDNEDGYFVAEDRGYIVASKTRRASVDASNYGYVVMSGVDDYTVEPSSGETLKVNWMHIVPSLEDTNELPKRVNVRYVGMAYLTPVENVLGIFKFWKRKMDGDAGKRDNIFEFIFQTGGLDINSFKVLGETTTKITFEGKRFGQIEYLEIEGNLKGFTKTDDNQLILSFSTNVMK